MTIITAELVKKLDAQGVYRSVLALPDQIEHAFQEVKPVKLPESYRRVTNLVVAGMGGSALGARLLDSLEYADLKIPLEIVNDYRLPAYVSDQTLVVLSSYSGSTEEVLVCYQQAKEAKSRLLAITTGGELAELAAVDKVPRLIFDPKFNPSKQPRMAIGYAIVALLALFSKLGFIRFDQDHVRRIVEVVKRQNDQLVWERPENPAIKLAGRLRGRIPILVAGEHLFGATHTTKNQLNENAKTFSALFAIPELNHHLMEGLRFPAANQAVLFFVFYSSDLYRDRVKTRLRLTKQLVERSQIPAFTYQAETASRLEQAFEVIQFGNFYNFYLAILNGVDPAPIPTVDWFKDELKKQ